MVQLQAEAGSRQHGDALHLEAVALIDGVEFAPGPEDLAVEHGQRLVVVAHAGDERPEVLSLVLGRYEHRVGGLHHHQVVGAEHRHQARIRMHERTPCVFKNDVSSGDVAVAVFVTHRPECRPAADVRPARVERHRHGFARGEFLHDRVVDGIGGAGHEGFVVHAHEDAVGSGAGGRGPAGGGDVRTEPFQGLQPDRALHHEDAAVPPVVAVVQIALGHGGVGLLNERGQHSRRRGPRSRSAGPEVAVAGLRPVGNDAEGDHESRLGQGCTLGHRRVEGR